MRDKMISCHFNSKTMTTTIVTQCLNCRHVYSIDSDHVLDFEKHKVKEFCTNCETEIEHNDGTKAIV